MQAQKQEQEHEQEYEQEQEHEVQRRGLKLKPVKLVLKIVIGLSLLSFTLQKRELLLSLFKGR